MKKMYLFLLGFCFALMMPSVQAGSAGTATLANLGIEETTSAPSLDKKELRKQVRALRKASKDDSDVLEIVAALVIPPLGVYLHEGDINNKFWIDLVLCLLFWFPGVVYALLVVLDVV